MTTSKKSKSKKNKIVRYTMQQILEKSEKRRHGEKTLMQLKSIKDEDIDYSDIPPLTKNFWKNAVLIKPARKKSITLRVDYDVLSFFKETVGKGYQTFINDVLRTYADAHKNPKH